VNRSAAIALPVRQGTDAWRDERQYGIGSSDAPATVDLDPHRSRLERWAEKVGYVEPQEETRWMRMGKLVEPVIALLYEEETGRKVRRRHQMLMHPEYPFIRASLDRVSGRRVVEIKKARDARAWGRSGSDDVPPHILIQVQHQLLVTGYPMADVAVLIAGDELRVYPIPADRTIQDRLLVKELAFWDCVLTMTPPTDIDGSVAAQRYITERYPEDAGHQLIPDNEFVDLVAQYRDAVAWADVAAAEARRLETQIKARMGAAALVEGPGWRITWKNAKDSKVIDWEAVARDIAPPKRLEAAIKAHTTTKPGSRRFLPKFKGDPE
jgi:putative phage-type endonuclease